MGGSIVYAIRLEFQSHRRDTRKCFQPSAGSSVPAEFQVQMIAVATQVIAQVAGSGILNSCSAGNIEREFRVQDLCPLNGIPDAVVHSFLTTAIVGKATVVRVLRVSPCHVPSVSHILTCFYTVCILDQLRQVWFVCRCQTTVMACLLKADKVPLLVGNDGWQ